MLSFSIEAELALERASGLAIEVKVTSFEEKLPIGPLTFRKSRLMKTTIESVDTAGLFISRLRSRCHPRNYLFWAKIFRLQKFSGRKWEYSNREMCRGTRKFYPTITGLRRMTSKQQPPRAVGFRADRNFGTLERTTLIFPAVFARSKSVPPAQISNPHQLP